MFFLYIDSSINAFLDQGSTPLELKVVELLFGAVPDSLAFASHWVGMLALLAVGTYAVVVLGVIDGIRRAGNTTQSLLIIDRLLRGAVGSGISRLAAVGLLVQDLVYIALLALFVVLVVVGLGLGAPGAIAYG